MIFTVGILRTQNSRPAKLRIQSYQRFTHFELGVVQNIVSHALPTAMDSVFLVHPTEERIAKECAVVIRYLIQFPTTHPPTNLLPFL